MVGAGRFVLAVEVATDNTEVLRLKEALQEVQLGPIRRNGALREPFAS